VGAVDLPSAKVDTTSHAELDTRMPKPPSPMSNEEPDERIGKSTEDKQEEAREILTRLYSKYCPSKIAQIDTLLDHYQGQEDTLCEKVREKYEGKSAKELDRIRQYVVQLYKEHAPHKLSNIDQLMKIYRGREEKLVDDLLLKYDKSKTDLTGGMGPSSSHNSTAAAITTTLGLTKKAPSYRQQVTDLYAEYAPHKLGDVDQLLARYRGREKQLMKDLNAKYKHTGKRFQPSGKLSREQLQGIGSMEPQANEPSAKASMIENIVFGAINAPKGKGGSRSTDDFDVEGRGRSMPRPTNKSRRRSTSVPPKKEEGPTPESVDFEIKVKCLDTGQEVAAGVVNTEVKDKWKGLCLRNLKGRDRFVAFFEKYDPAQIDFIDEMLKNGGKTEEEVWYDLQCKYEVNQRGRLLALLKFLGQHGLVHKIDNLLANYEGREELLIAYYMQKAKPLMEAREASRDPKTWKAGEDNTYQMLPGFDLGD